MNRLRYAIAKITRDEEWFSRISAPEAELFAALRGKNVALVGNARALAEREFGAAIDSADIVVRINGAPRPSALSHGTRTDWLTVGVKRLDASFLNSIGNPRVLWMSPKLRRLTWDAARTPGFYRYPGQRYEALRAQIGDGPTTGLMTIALLAESELASLRLYGFDFFASLTLTNQLQRNQFGHNSEGEAGWVAALYARDPRVTLVK